MTKRFKLPSLNEWADKNYRPSDRLNEYDTPVAPEDPGMGPGRNYNTVSVQRFDPAAFARLPEAEQAKEIRMRIKQFDDMQTKISEMIRSFEEMMKGFISDKNDMWSELVEIMTDYEKIATAVRRELEDYKVTFKKAHSRQQGPGYRELYEILMTKVNPATRNLMNKLQEEQTVDVPVKPTLKVSRVQESLLTRVVDWFKAMYSQITGMFRPAKDSLSDALVAIKALKASNR